MNYVFVYGSLKKGYHNNVILSESEYIGSFKTNGKFEMTSFGSFPAIHKGKDEKNIIGEVYVVNDDILHDLDRLEGEGWFYKRTIQTVTSLDKTNTLSAWVYVCLEPSERTCDLRYENVYTNITEDAYEWQK